MRRLTAGRTGPGVLGGVLQAGALVAVAAVPLAAILLSAGWASQGPGAGGGRPLANVGPMCYPDDPECGSPVIFDVNRSGYHLTSAAGGVLFDFVGHGHLIRIAWTAPGSTNAFLVLPRAGRVDDGSELFGNLSPQPLSTDPNGFAALAVWDQPGNGGDGDGVIDKGDAVWSRLRLWQDTNHDGKVEPGELHPLSAFGITGISVRYHAAGGFDRYGNRYGYAATVYGTEHAAPVAYDFFLATTPAGSVSPNSWLIAAVAAATGAAVLAGAALATRRRRQARTRALAPVSAGQAEPDRDVPVSIGR